MAQFKKFFVASGSKNYEYLVYPGDQTQFDRVMVYIHGLVSDFTWFKVPENLPKGTGILFIQRYDRYHTEKFEHWWENFEACFLDFKKNYTSSHFHLYANCFGSLAATHWAINRPDHFTTLTLASPLVARRLDYSLKEKLKMGWALLANPKRPFDSKIVPRTYGRTASLLNTIKNNPTAKYYFSAQHFYQANRAIKWLEKNMIYFPVPTHCLFFSDDQVVKHEAFRPIKPLKDFPEKVSYFYGDHYSELLPNATKNWEEVFSFMRQNENKGQWEGEIKTVLVTGSTGFLGGHCVRDLLQKGYHLVALARNISKAKKLFCDLEGKEGFEIREGDLDNLETLDKALEGIDAVVHSAGFVSEWDTYDKFEKVNVEGTKNLAIMAHDRGVKQIVHISSLGVFGDTDQDMIDENNAYQLSSDYYSNSKIYAEIFIRKYCTQNKIPYNIVRPGFIYGEGDNNFFPNLLNNFKKGKVKYIGSKGNYLNTVYVKNVTATVCHLVANPDTVGETYNISDPGTTTIETFLETVASALNLRPPTKVIPKKVALTMAGIFENTFRFLKTSSPPPITRKKVTFVGRSRSVCTDKVYSLLKGAPFDFDRGLSQTLDHMKKNSLESGGIYG